MNVVQLNYIVLDELPDFKVAAGGRASDAGAIVGGTGDTPFSSIVGEADGVDVVNTRSILTALARGWRAAVPTIRKRATAFTAASRSGPEFTAVSKACGASNETTCTSFR